MRKENNILSEKEQKLLDFIGTREADITIKLIETELGKEYTGAIGKLIQRDLIEKTKKKTEEASNPYGWKFVKVYIIKKEGEKNDEGK